MTRVDEVQNLIAGWCGLTEMKPGDRKPCSVTMPVQDMLKVRDKHAWREERHLSARIGRIFQDAERTPRTPRTSSDLTAFLYKVLFMRYRSGEWLAVDTELNEHRLTVMKRGRHLLPQRSLSICKRQIEDAFDFYVQERESKLMASEDTASLAMMVKVVSY